MPTAVRRISANPLSICPHPRPFLPPRHLITIQLYNWILDHYFPMVRCYIKAAIVNRETTRNVLHILEDIALNDDRRIREMGVFVLER